MLENNMILSWEVTLIVTVCTSRDKHCAMCSEHSNPNAAALWEGVL